MRYRIGEAPGSGTSTDDMLLFTMAISLIVGIVLVWLARRGRQMWLFWWSIGLILASFAYLGWVSFV
jgi:hypothetical protein